MQILTLVVFVSSIALSASLVSEPTAVSIGEKLSVKFSGLATRDVITLYKVGSDTLFWKAKPRGRAGTLTLTAPTDTGLYEFRQNDLKSPRVSVVRCPLPSKPQSKIEHLVVVVSENHSFDSYFGRYCQGKTGTLPDCTEGADCCAAGPQKTPGNNSPPILLNDETNRAFDPNHNYDCNVSQANHGKMDKFIAGVGPDKDGRPCSDPRNFAYADEKSVSAYWELARKNAMGDRVFQSVQGASSSNNMYLTRGGFLFKDNEVYPKAIGATCSSKTPQKQFNETSIQDVLSVCGVSATWFAEGYRAAKAAHPKCAGRWPYGYDPSDIPVTYYPSLVDKQEYLQDYVEFLERAHKGTLPAISFLKGAGYRSEHPKDANISNGIYFMNEVVDAITRSPIYSKNTLVIVTPDEGGGYFDHVPPPPASEIDGRPYGVRIFMIAAGPFAKKNYVSHVQMEHTSILKFIEWNWLGETGQLGTRDTIVNNIGSLLDPKQTGVVVPEK